MASMGALSRSLVGHNWLSSLLLGGIWWDFIFTAVELKPLTHTLSASVMGITSFVTYAAGTSSYTILNNMTVLVSIVINLLATLLISYKLWLVTIFSAINGHDDKSWSYSWQGPPQDHQRSWAVSGEKSSVPSCRIRGLLPWITSKFLFCFNALVKYATVGCVLGGMLVAWFFGPYMEYWGYSCKLCKIHFHCILHRVWSESPTSLLFVWHCTDLRTSARQCLQPSYSLLSTQSTQSKIQLPSAWYLEEFKWWMPLQ